MSIHWKDLTKNGRIEAIRSVYEAGMTSRQIAAHFAGATRNAVIGMYTRYPDKLAGCSLPPHGLPSVRTIKKSKGLTVKRPTLLKPAEPGAEKWERSPVPEPYGAGRKLTMLQSQQCKWPVNDAEPGDLHLFCGLPAEGSYCGHHTTRSFRTLDRGALK